MLNRWLENEPKETLICAVTSAIFLVLSITGVLKGILPFDIAWVAIILCGVPILVDAFKGVVFEHDIKANLLPEEKMNIIKGYAGGAEPICMIGDGVNDALALTSADAGIAMGGIGSDIAVESADAVLVSDEIKRLPYLFSLMQKVMKKVQVNIIASLVINLSAVVLSALGVLNPVTGALWHNCGSVLVVVNEALLLRLKDTDSGN